MIWILASLFLEHSVYIHTYTHIYTVSQKKMWFQTFCSKFINCWPILKILSLLERAINYLQNKYNISRHFLKALLHHVFWDTVYIHNRKHMPRHFTSGRQYSTLHCIALHCIALHCIALHCIALHCIALHYITLHYITYIQTGQQSSVINTDRASKV